VAPRRRADVETWRLRRVVDVATGIQVWRRDADLGTWRHGALGGALQACRREDMEVLSTGALETRGRCADVEAWRYGALELWSSAAGMRTSCVPSKSCAIKVVCHQGVCHQGICCRSGCCQGRVLDLAIKVGVTEVDSGLCYQGGHKFPVR